MTSLKIAIGSDHAGFNLKNQLKDYVKELGHKVTDFGTIECVSCDYPIIAFKASVAVANKEFDRGILICGTGLGMAIAANKVKGIRAVTCMDGFSAEMSVRHNNANILTLGERVIGLGLAKSLVKIWLETTFEAGRHQERVSLIDSYDD